jgi:uncharacterized repeat protein (TIGR03803 family)
MFDTKKNVEALLYSFGSVANDGTGPNGSLIISGTTLYGMTPNGGTTNNNGTIFMFDTKKNVETVLYNFGSVAKDGANPCDSLIISGTTLYGMTNAGGANGKGTIFMFDTKKNVETVLYSFGSVAHDGINPFGSLILAGTTLYGMTPDGGANGNGTIFEISTQGKGYKVLYSFGDMPDGANPWGSLILAGTTLYGTTTNGGANDAGTIFEINTQGKGYKVLYSFPGWPYAFDPRGSLILSGTTLYGTADQLGGTNGYGTIFMFDTKTNAETVLHDFGSIANDGAWPESGSLTLTGTTLYGKTCWGGAYDYGTIFSISAIPPSTISGTVTQNTSAGPAMEGVTVTLSQPGWTETQITGSSGAYSFPDLAPGNYTVTPSLPGYAFTPKSGSMTVNGSNVTENFTGAPVTISGTVTFNGAPVITNLIMDLSGKATGTDTPNESGYIFGPLANGTYTVKPALTHSKPVPAATPASASIGINGKSATQGFTYKTNSGCFVSGCHTK